MFQMQQPNFTNWKGVEVGRFPDGMPSLQVKEPVASWRGIEIALEVRITSAEDVLQLALFLDVMGPVKTLHIRYLMGGRMDRPNGVGCPRTLRVVCDMLNALPVTRFGVFGPHSQSSLDLLRDSYGDWDTGRDAYRQGIIACRRMVPPNLDEKHPVDNETVSFVLPDAGAYKNFTEHYPAVFQRFPEANKVLLYKHRILESGKIASHQILEGTVRKRCIILDDLCDGGATFVSAAELLREHGAEFVGLVVLHGIFSKGTRLEGIDHIATTNSFKEWDANPYFSVNNVL